MNDRDTTAASELFHEIRGRVRLPENVSAEDAARLFERGYRGTHAGHSQGGGIGLSIVRRLCELYGWDVRVAPGAERGVVATLTFG